MSDSLRDFIDDVEDRIEDVADDVENEIDDIADDVDDGGAPSTTSAAAQVTRLYDAAFDRAPDDAGLTFWTNVLRTDAADLDDVAELFVASPEFRDRYGDTDDSGFVDLLYRNVLDREPDAAGRALWVGALARDDGLDRDEVLLAFSESPEHVAKVGPVSTDDNPLI